jgi:hypothetical protein
VGPLVPTVGTPKGLAVDMSYEQTMNSIRHSGVQEILRRAQEVEDEITEQRSIVTAHVQSGVS